LGVPPTDLSRGGLLLETSSGRIRYMRKTWLPGLKPVTQSVFQVHQGGRRESVCDRIPSILIHLFLGVCRESEPFRAISLPFGKNHAACWHSLIFARRTECIIETSKSPIPRLDATYYPRHRDNPSQVANQCQDKCRESQILRLYRKYFN